jgi:hypothetical protein
MAATEEKKQRSWAEKHGGTLYILGAFVLVALLVLVRGACS